MECIRVYRVNVLCQVSFWGAAALSTGTKIVTQSTIPTQLQECLLFFHKTKGGNLAIARGVGDVFFFRSMADESGGACPIVETGGGVVPCSPLPSSNPNGGNLGGMERGAAYRLAVWGAG